MENTPMQTGGTTCVVSAPAAVPITWSWRWSSWASWPVTPSILATSGFAVVLDAGSAWWGRPSWHLGGVLVSPALPLAALLVTLVGVSRVGGACRALAAWREYLVGGSLVVVIASAVFADTVERRRLIGGVLLAAASEEIVYRLAVVVLIGAACARVRGRDWRDTSTWGTGSTMVALLGAAVVFSALPGHIGQMTGATSVAPFASLAVLLGYVALRTGSLLPAIVAHVFLDVVNLAHFAGQLSAAARGALAASALTALVLGLMVAGRRLGLRRPTPVEIDLRGSGVVTPADYEATALAAIGAGSGSSSPVITSSTSARNCDAELLAWSIICRARARAASRRSRPRSGSNR